jgi:hypothetical protein
MRNEEFVKDVLGMLGDIPDTEIVRVGRVQSLPELKTKIEEMKESVIRTK